MTNDTLLPFALPAGCRKKVTAAFDCGRLTSDGGVLLLSGADKQLGLCEMLAGLIPDRRDEARVTHQLEDILRSRVFAIAGGYPDADDLDDPRSDPAFKLACGRLPESGDDLASQPTILCWESAPAGAEKPTLVDYGGGDFPVGVRVGIDAAPADAAALSGAKARLVDPATQSGCRGFRAIAWRQRAPMCEHESLLPRRGRRRLLGS